MDALPSTGFVEAHGDARSRHESFRLFLKETAAQISARSLIDVTSLQDWMQRREALRRELLFMLGLDPMPKRTPLKVQVTGVLERPAYRIEKIVFQSMPRLYVTGNLYVPHGLSRRAPAILYVCGHSPDPRGAKVHYQDRAAWFASHGCVCLVLDTLEFGEVAGIHHGIHDLNMWHWLSLGYTPVGVEVWNAMRALDYLEMRAEVDDKRIGMTGISGGGAVTWYTAAVDERVAAAAPVCSTITFGSQAAHWRAAGQCDCIYFHNTYQEDFPLVGALIAPRPLLICSGRRDGDFPPDGYHEVYRRAKQVYDLYAGHAGGSDRIVEVDDDVGHQDAPLFLHEARRWMNHWLKNDLSPPEEQSPGATTPESAEDLACLTRLPPDAVNYSIHDRFIPSARLARWRSPAAWQDRRRALLGELRDKVFRWFPTGDVSFRTGINRNDGGWAARYADYADVVFDSEAGVPVRAQLIRPKSTSPDSTLLIYAKRAGDSIYPLDLDELLPVLGRYSVLILNPRLTEHPVGASEYAEIERTASWIGRTVGAMQVWDILRAVEWAAREAQIESGSVAVYGKGDMGILALYAALFQPRIRHVVFMDPPTSHWQGAALLNVLRITDIPEAAAAAAPCRLTFLREIPAAFGYTRKLYALQGCPSGIRRAASLADALEVWNSDHR